MAVTVALPQLKHTHHFNEDNKVKLFTGRANPELAQEIAEYLGMELSTITVKNFNDGEIYVQVEESVRGDDVFIIQPTCNPVNENLVELLLMIDAFKRASAKKINVVLPYYGYARQDRKCSGREAISAKLVADLITTAGANRVIALDLHTGQLQGFFNIMVDHLFATPVFINYLKQKPEQDNFVMVSPDAGGVERVRAYAKKLNCPIAIVDKRRTGHGVAETVHLVGEVAGKHAVIIDDMIDTAGSISSAAKMLAENGALSVTACAVHAVFSGPAIERLIDSPISEVLVSNSIPLPAAANNHPKFKQLSIAAILGEAISRIHDDVSVSEMFD